MNVTFFPRYSRNGASSRYRFFMYADALREQNWQLECLPFFDENYLQNLYHGGGKSKSAWLQALLHRWWSAAHPGQRAVIEYELLPFIPAAVELFLLRDCKYVLNFDDNVWEKYSRTFLQDKFDCLVRQAAGVIVANDFLYRKVQNLQKNVIKIPTVVDTALYNPDLVKYPRFTLVWIGTPVTYSYLEQFAGTLQAMARNVDFDLLVIGGKQLESRAIPDVKMHFADWSEAAECELIGRAHVGIMPLSNDNFSRGKSAFKLIQYQACGLPSIASAVGENCTVIQDGVNGFLANTPEEWVRALQRLSGDRNLYSNQRRAALSRRKAFSFEHYLPIYRQFLEKTLQ